MRWGMRGPFEDFQDVEGLSTTFEKLVGPTWSVCHQIWLLAPNYLDLRKNINHTTTTGTTSLDSIFIRKKGGI